MVAKNIYIYIYILLCNKEFTSVMDANWMLAEKTKREKLVLYRLMTLVLLAV